MFFGKKHRTLTFKLVSLYISLYLCSFLLFMVVSFLFFYRLNEKREMKTIFDEIQEIEDKTRTGSFDDLVRVSSEEILELGSTNLLIHLRHDGHDLFLPTRAAWDGYSLGAIPCPPPGQIENMPNAKNSTTLKVGSALLPNGAAFQVGYISTASQDLCRHFGDVFSVIFIPILLAGVAIGTYMVRRSLRDISQVRKTAIRIYRGDLDSRVQRSYNGDELDQLSETFNLMLSRIHFLIRNMIDMVDSLAHDLRSPLTKLKVSAELALLQDQAPDQYRAVIEKTLPEYDRIITLVNHVLSVSEAEAGVTRLHFETVDVGEFLASLYEFYAPLAADAGIDFVMDDVPALSLRIDKARIWQCLGNIVDNAFKFTRKGGRIGLSARQAGERVTIAISDTGIGISDKDLPYIFERFFKVDKGRNDQGYGLGLSFAKAIIAMHGGSISVESRLGEGTTFSIGLPTTPMST